MTIETADAVPDFKLWTLDECADAKPEPHVVKALIPVGSFCMIFGQPGAGKSVLAPHLAVCVAAGQQFFDHRVRQAPVLYVAGEDILGIRQRFEALRRVHGPVPGLKLIAEAMDLAEFAHQKALGRAIIAHRPGLVILDTMASVFPDLDENDPAQMGVAIQAMGGLSINCGSAVMVLHHPPKSGDTPRGHSKLNAALDLTLHVEGSGTDQRKVTARKNRAGPSGTGFAFAIKSLDLGVDADGDRITAPVVDPDAKAEADPAKAGWTPTGHAKNVLDTLNDLVVRGVGTAPPPRGSNVPDGVLAVRVSEWRKAFMRKSAPDEPADGDPQQGKPKEGSARKAFDRSWPQLQAHKFVGIFDGWAWSAKR